MLFAAAPLRVAVFLERGCHDADFSADFFASWYSRRFNFYYHNFDSSEILEIAVKSSNMSWPWGGGDEEGRVDDDGAGDVGEDCDGMEIVSVFCKVLIINSL